MLWPTATASAYGTNAGGQNPGPPRPSLNTLGARWATATATDYKTTSKPGQRRGQLADQLWPTATATDASGSRRAGYMDKGNPGTTLHDAIDSHHGEETRTAGQPGEHAMVLNPAFVEALMGFPPGWLDGIDDDA